MKKILVLVMMIIIAGGVSPRVLASSTPNLQVQIFPLECSLDSVALGNVSLLQLTPENCMPGQPEPPTVISPLLAPENSPSHNPSGNPIFLNDPILHIPSPNFPINDIKGPLIIDPEEKVAEKNPSNAQTNAVAVGVTVLVTAGVLAAAHALYTGVIAPLIAQGNLPNIRFPWSKK